MKRRIALLVAIVLALSLITSCGSEPSATSTPSPSENTAAPTAAPVATQTPKAPAASTTTPSSTATNAPATEPPVVEPTPVPTEVAFVNPVELDLSQTKFGEGTYMEGEGFMAHEDVTIIGFKLPVVLEPDQTIQVRVKGSSEDNFRSWLVDDEETTISDIIIAEDDFDFFGGEFEFTYELMATDPATYIIFKAPTYDGLLSGFLVYNVTVGYPEGVVIPQN